MLDSQEREDLYLCLVGCRAAVRDSLAGEANWPVEIRCFASKNEFLASLDRCQAGVAIIDLRLPHALSLIEELAAETVAFPTLAICDKADTESVLRAFRSGVSDVVYVSELGSILRRRVGDLLNQDASRIEHRRTYIRLRDCFRSLTRRERQVMERVVAGRRNWEIAAALGITAKTVEVHRRQVMTKTRASSLAELVRMSIMVDEADGRSDGGDNYIDRFADRLGVIRGAA